MKLNVINITESTGIAKKTQKPFCIRQLSFIGDFETVNTETYQRSGAGFTPVELPISDACFSDLLSFFQQSFIGVPLLIDLESSINSRGQTLITGFNKKLPMTM